MLLLLLISSAVQSSKVNGPILIVSNPDLNKPVNVRLHSTWREVQNLLPPQTSVIRTSQFSMDDVYNSQIDKLLEKENNMILFPVVMDSITLEESTIRDIQPLSKAIEVFREEALSKKPVVLISGHETHQKHTRDVLNKGKINLSYLYLTTINKDGNTKITRYNPKGGSIPMEFNDGNVQVEFDSEDAPEHIVFKASFYKQSDFWYLNQSYAIFDKLDPIPLQHYACSSQWNMKTPINYSYVCAATEFRPTFSNLSEDITFLSVSIEKLQLQPFDYTDQFGPANDCVCYLTTAMWMGVLFKITFIYFVHMALSSMSNIEGPVKFPSPQSKMISVPGDSR